jgi:hypothetical protein
VTTGSRRAGRPDQTGRPAHRPLCQPGLRHSAPDNLVTPLAGWSELRTITITVTAPDRGPGSKILVRWPIRTLFHSQVARQRPDQAHQPVPVEDVLPAKRAAPTPPHARTSGTERCAPTARSGPPTRPCSAAGSSASTVHACRCSRSQQLRPATRHNPSAYTNCRFRSPDPTRQRLDLRNSPAHDHEDRSTAELRPDGGSQPPPRAPAKSPPSSNSHSTAPEDHRLHRLSPFAFVAHDSGQSRRHQDIDEVVAKRGR